MARTVLDPRYKKHLNSYNGAGETAEFLLNSGRVQTLLMGNYTKLDIIRKAFEGAGMPAEGILNGNDAIKKLRLILNERTKENKLNSFLNSLKSALLNIDGDNIHGMYYDIFCSS